ncbi:MAG: hypothetical protein IJF59_02705, partial [Clostridia bacterium]|nr:hypothetical protein [Clostridia bacterium]
FTAVFDRRGEVVSAVVSVEDVSEMYERTRVRSIEFEGLLKAMQQVFPEMISLNVTRGTYRMLQYDQATTVGSPVEGQLSRLVELRVPYVLAEDQQMFSETFHVAEMRERLKNNDVIRLAYRRAAPGGEWVWMETTVMRHSNPFDEDVLAVAVSQNIDEQKAEEDRLREELHLRAEEIRLSAEKMGHVLCTYDVPTRTLTIPADQAARLGMGQVLEQFPDTLDQAGNLPAEAVATLKTFYENIHSGAPRGRCEIIVLDQRGQERWERLEFATVFDREGVPRRTVISVDDVTDLRVQSVENRRLKENEQLLRIFAEHSSRTLCLYRTKTGLAHRWDEARCANCKVPKLCRMTYPEMLRSGEIMPESVEAMREMFQEIHRGRSEGTLRACMKDDEGRRRWYDIRYSTLYDDIRQPMGAIISHEDVTDRHEQELAWLRFRQRQEQQSARFTIHCDLTADRVDSVSGALDTVPLPFTGDSYSESLTRLLTVALPADQLDGAGRFFARDHLLAAHAEGSRRLTGDFRVLREDGSHGWVEALVELVADPYVGHIRALISISDNTGAKEQQLAVEARAEKDGMTGLLNRATCEER